MWGTKHPATFLAQVGFWRKRLEPSVTLLSVLVFSPVDGEGLGAQNICAAGTLTNSVAIFKIT